MIPQYNYMVQPPAEMIVPQPGSKMAKYKTSLCKHFEQTGTCQMDSRCHFAHGKHELRKQTDALPSHVFKLYQTPVNTVAPPGYVHNKYKTVPCKNFLEGLHCKYGDRCTFAHGDQDMRAKFVKAELLYSPGAYPGSADPSQIQTMPPTSGFGTVDYSVFSQPPPLAPPMDHAQAPTKVVPEAVEEAKAKGASDYGSDFQIPAFDGNNFQDEENNFFNSFNYNNNGFGIGGYSGVDESPTSGDYFSKQTGPRNTSKFDFCYDYTDNSPKETSLVNQMMNLKVSPDPLSDRIEDLELTSDNKDIIQKFSQAKYQIEMGNIEEGNKILNQMMESKEIAFKKYSEIDQDILKTFAPISD